MPHAPCAQPKNKHHCPNKKGLLSSRKQAFYKGFLGVAVFLSADAFNIDTHNGNGF
jgi:hypothetical protein